MLLLLPTAPPAGGAATTAWCQSLAAGAPVVDVLGDSVARGDRADDEHRWPLLLQQSLVADGYPNAQVWSGGAVAGSTTADFLPGGPQHGHIAFTRHRPPLIIMNWGINDWYYRVPVQTYRQQFQAIIDEVRGYSPDSLIVLLHSPWVYNPQQTAERGPQEPYAVAMRDLALANNLPMINLEWAFPGDNRWGGYHEDLVHPSNAGNNTIFGIVREVAMQLCPPLRRGVAH
ncbi:lysophospholipase L1-like esterase [Saccharothrix coeruleofusca]|uniref:SGNH/GDSL hydrolase family protein n=1 Tax=Saccharothrix coeruleofusca TaxID=33919 RepID=UPI001AE14354|nr:SGNH/GDSL hydrolase family protein [Saccharothrix coeruleofusca]MBP2336846.1 lysophospholipase L1-like esterase [Saccharothrix coeruleofusca]